MDVGEELRDLVMAMVGDNYPLTDHPNLNVCSALYVIAEELQLLRKAIEASPDRSDAPAYLLNEDVIKKAVGPFKNEHGVWAGSPEELRAILHKSGVENLPSLQWLRRIVKKIEKGTDCINISIVDGIGVVMVDCGVGGSDE